MKILIIDAESRRPRQLRILLSSLGHRLTDVIHAGDLKAACGLLKKRQFECVFMHVLDSGEAPFEAVHRVRAWVPASTKLFAYGHPPSRQRVLEARSSGASNFLVYPFTACDVEEAIHPARIQRNVHRAIST